MAAAKPIEQRRRTQTGHKPIPPAGSLHPLPGAPRPPAPARRLGPEGRAMWDRVWTSGAVWLAADIDSETILVLCEMIDQREQLRASATFPDAWRERATLRGLTKDILAALGMLGFNPVDRVRLGVAEVEPVSKLDDLIKRRQSRTGTQTGT